MSSVQAKTKIDVLNIALSGIPAVSVVSSQSGRTYAISSSGAGVYILTASPAWVTPPIVQNAGVMADAAISTNYERRYGENYGAEYFIKAEYSLSPSQVQITTIDQATLVPVDTDESILVYVLTA